MDHLNDGLIQIGDSHEQERDPDELQKSLGDVPHLSEEISELVHGDVLPRLQLGQGKCPFEDALWIFFP